MTTSDPADLIVPLAPSSALHADWSAAYKAMAASRAPERSRLCHASPSFCANEGFAVFNAFKYPANRPEPEH